MAETPEIVIGIDYGTTHSGASWAFLSGKKDITIIKNWPNRVAKNSTSDKVSSSIAYRAGNVDSWGYMIKPDDPSVITLNWIKLLLEPKNNIYQQEFNARESAQLLAKMGKAPATAVADYLGQLWTFVKAQIEKNIGGGDLEDTHTVHVVLTCPAIWSDKAKDRTLNAAHLAGMPKMRTSLVTEPEAAALAVFHEHSDRHLLSTGDVIIICDAGGGTVDLLSYKVESTEPLRITECAQGDGDICGSTVLDRLFINYIKYLVKEEAWSKTTHKSQNKMMQDFEYNVKRAFDGTNDDLSVDLRGAGDNPAKGINDDTITLGVNDMKTLFETIFGMIITLIDKQIRQITASGLTPKMIMLVGGFGESDYLFKRLEKEYQRKNIQILSSIGAWSAITRGATLWGLEHSVGTTFTSGSEPSICATVTSRIERHSYGFIVSHPFDKRIHDVADRYVDKVDGAILARNQMLWLVKKGTAVQDGVPFRSEGMQYVKEDALRSTPSTKWKWLETMYYCDEDRPPTSSKSTAVHQLCELECSVPSALSLRLDMQKVGVGDGLLYRKLDLTTLMYCGNSIRFAIEYRNEVCGTVETQYAEI